MSSPDIKVIPSKVYMQRDEYNIHLNFDFRIEGSRKPLLLTSIVMLAYDRDNNLLIRKFLDSNGISPGIHIIPNREIPAGGYIDIFNPFHRLEPYLDIAYLRYIFQLETEEGMTIKLERKLFPVEYRQKVNLRLPFNGDFIVYDGHDYYSHHRRLLLSHPLMLKMGVKANSGRFAYDFCAIDEHGNLHKGKPKRNEDYFTFNKPIYAPADGKIVEAVQNIEDNSVGEPLKYTLKDFIEKPKLLAGNYIIINHGSNEYSVICHIRQHSLKVKVGEKVTQGQIIASAGNSGASDIPHIHYQLQNGRDILSSEGLPSLFKNYYLILGSKGKHIPAGYPKTGERLRNIYNQT